MKIVLIGFMGSGKTTIADSLAYKLKLELIEMDELALKKTERKTINEIFKKDGEKSFRKLEYTVAREISNKDNVVISSGGGVVMDKSVMNHLTKNGFVIYLEANFGKIKERIALKRIKPPLFQDADKAKKLFDLRIPLYKAYANLVINTENKTVDQIVKQIVKGLNGRK